jgi:Fur family transcriptional regulator, ferric uptake regulator
VTSLDDALELLRGRGLRVTTARRAVLVALLDAHGHLRAEDLAAVVQGRHPDIHLSTVYRALETFEEVGLVTHVHLGHGPSTYHLADQLHHHAVCEVCGRVVELPDDVLDGVAARVRDEFGFEVDARHFALAGRCAGCG